MRKNSFKKIITTVLTAAMIVVMACPVFAADTEVTGTDGTPKEKEIPITAEINSVYTVALPAALTLTYRENVKYLNRTTNEEKVGNIYAANIRYGCAGKITSEQEVYVSITFPCVMSNASNASFNLDQISSYSEDTADYTPAFKSTWQKNEIGTCDYNGVALTNVVYSYSDNEGTYVGVAADDIPEAGSYSGNLVINFGIRSR